MHLEDAKILIADDSILARKQLKDMISTLGTPVFFEAKDGQGAIDQYKQNKPDLVFLDIVMPSSIGTQSQLKKAIEAGAKEFIQKPLDQQQVITTVNRFLEGR